jgi:hypothetical protein
MKVQYLLVGLLIAGSSAPMQAQLPPYRSSPAPAPKPLPSALVRAKTAIVVNDSPAGSRGDTEFKQLQTELGRWKRFQVVTDASRADVSISLSTKQVETLAQGGAPVGAKLANPRRSIVRSDVSTVTVRQLTTGETLWTASGGSVATLVRTLEAQMPLGGKVCFAVWCR